MEIENIAVEKTAHLLYRMVKISGFSKNWNIISDKIILTLPFTTTKVEKKSPSIRNHQLKKIVNSELEPDLHVRMCVF